MNATRSPDSRQATIEDLAGLAWTILVALAIWPLYNDIGYWAVGLIMLALLAPVVIRSELEDRAHARAQERAPEQDAPGLAAESDGYSSPSGRCDA